MDEKILVTQSGECFRTRLIRSQGSYNDERRHEFMVEDLKAKRGVREMTVVFTRKSIVNAGDFKSREHILYWNAIRRAFDENKVSFEIKPEDPDKYIELILKWADIEASRGQASDENVSDYLKAKAYWLGYKYKSYENPKPTFVNLESEEDFEYLGVTLNDLRRVFHRFKQQGLLVSSGFPLVAYANPTDNLIKEFEARSGKGPIMKEHEHVLDFAAQGKLPERIDSSSSLSLDAVKELMDAGYLKAIDASSLDGAAYLSPKITLAGRGYLDQLRERAEGKQMTENKLDYRLPDIPSATFADQNTWAEIEREYDVSKKTLGRTVSFVKDEFKRKVIFRDIEHAFLLAHRGYYKSSVILAGGVIEELLRLYLAHRNVAPENNGLDSYIKACEANGLIKGAIPKLADSVRHFRNCVHLKQETSARDSISKAAAKGAVSSVFTIARELAP